MDALCRFSVSVQTGSGIGIVALSSIGQTRVTNFCATRGRAADAKISVVTGLDCGVAGCDFPRCADVYHSGLKARIARCRARSDHRRFQDRSTEPYVNRSFQPEARPSEQFSELTACTLLAASNQHHVHIEQLDPTRVRVLWNNRLD